MHAGICDHAAQVFAHLQDFPLRTLVKQQRLLVQRVQSFPRNLGFLLGNVRSIIQKIDLHVRSLGQTGQQEQGNETNLHLLKVPL